MPLTSPKTNEALVEANSRLAPNVALRSLLIEFRRSKQQEWEAAKRWWREAQQQEEGRGGALGVQ